MNMEITVTQSSIVKPARPTPLHDLWVSNLDLLATRHTVMAYLYNPLQHYHSTSYSCVWKRLREALAEALVHFYPLAGRLTYDVNGRITVNCNGEGAIYVEAVTDSEIVDLGDFERPSDLQPLVPPVTYTNGITSLPLLIQVTKFKCGGVGIGVSISHVMSDGIASLHFVNTWCDIARGSGVSLAPFIDRSSLRARDPPAPSFTHSEYSPPPSLLSADGDEQIMNTQDVSYCRFRLDREQLKALKAKVARNPESKPYSTYVTLSAHVWKCCCSARNLLDGQNTKLYIAVEGRHRLRPQLPNGYFGNARFMATPIAISGEISSKPVWYTAGKIQEEISRMDDGYLRSQLDYLELKRNLSLPGDTFSCPNLKVTSWNLPIYDADFGWGKPVFMGPVRHPKDGECYIIPSPIDDGGVSICVGMYSPHMERFRKLFYEIKLYSHL